MSHFDFGDVAAELVVLVAFEGDSEGDSEVSWVEGSGGSGR